MKIKIKSTKKEGINPEGGIGHQTIHFEEDEIRSADEDINKGFNVTYAVKDGLLLGYFAIADQIKSNITASIKRLSCSSVET